MNEIARCSDKDKLSNNSLNNQRKSHINSRKEKNKKSKKKLWQSSKLNF